MNRFFFLFPCQCQTGPAQRAGSYSDVHTPHTAIPTATWRQICHKPSACSTTHTFCPHRGRCRQVNRPPASYKHRALGGTDRVGIHSPSSLSLTAAKPGNTITPREHPPTHAPTPPAVSVSLHHSLLLSCPGQISPRLQSD